MAAERSRRQTWTGAEGEADEPRPERPGVWGAVAPQRDRARRLAVVVRPGDGLGFRLAGVRVEEVPRGGEAAAFRALLAEPELGVAAVEEDVLASAPERLLRRARERGLPVLLPFALPRRWGEEGRGRAYVAALIRRAVGYGVKLGGAPGGPG